MNNEVERELIEFKGKATAKLESIEESIKDLKTNHLPHIYKELKFIVVKLSSRRPAWSVVWLLTGLVSIVAVLLREVLR